MRQINALILGMALVSGTSAQEREIPKLEQVGSIWLKTHPTAWEAKFYRGGTATLNYGSGGSLSPQRDTPPGSFPLEEVYNLLVPRLKPERSMTLPLDMSVFLFTGNVSTCSWCIEQTEENKAVVRALLGELLDKATIPGHFYSKEQFDEFLATEPFIEGDLPPIFEYKKAYTREQKEKAEVLMRDEVRMRRVMQRRYLASREEEARAIEEELAQWKAERGFPNDEEDDADTPPANRPWLYAIILSALCAGAILYFIRRKRT